MIRSQGRAHGPLHGRRLIRQGEWVAHQGTHLGRRASPRRSVYLNTFLNTHGLAERGENGLSLRTARACYRIRARSTSSRQRARISYRKLGASSSEGGFRTFHRRARSGLVHDEATDKIDGLAGNILSLIRRKKCREVGHVLRGLEAAGIRFLGWLPAAGLPPIVTSERRRARCGAAFAHGVRGVRSGEAREVRT